MTDVHKAGAGPSQPLPSSIQETNEIPVIAAYDVIVVGGGVAGVSAAVAARRTGATVLLIEKGVMLGGLATMGMIAIFLPLCDGHGNQVITGIAEELLHLSIKYGCDSLPAVWGGQGAAVRDGRYQSIFSPAEFAVALDGYVDEARVDVLFDTAFSRPIMEEERCQGVIVENKSGRTAFLAQTIVDASGDADVFARAGAPCAESANWLSYWAYTAELRGMKEALQRERVAVGVRLRQWGRGPDGSGNGTPARKYRGTAGFEVSAFIRDGRRLAAQYLQNEKRRDRTLAALPSMPQFRTTRRIRGTTVLEEDAVGRWAADSIGCTGDWRTAGPVYEIPYGTLVTQELTNVLAAGRIISAAGDTWEVTRVIPTACLTGQAAGTAAALAAASGRPVAALDVSEIQANLRAQGVTVHLDEVMSGDA